jgi:hypothetical protein
VSSITTINRTTSTWIREVAERLARSGPFEGASPAQLEARIWIGLALALDPGTACGNITFARGKPAFSAALQAALLVRHPRYSSKIITITDTRAEIAFFLDGQQVGVSSFTIEEAKRAGLTSKSAWQGYPGDLVFARALTRGVRRYAPDLLVGNAAYTLEETGADTHEPIPAELKAKPSAKEKPSAKNAPAKPTRGTVANEQLQELKACREELRIPEEAWRGQILAKRGVHYALELSTEKAAELISALRTKINVRQMQEGLSRQATTGNGADLVTNLQAVGKGKEVTQAAGPTHKSDKRDRQLATLAANPSP